MFNNLSSSLGKIFDKLKGKGYLNEDDVNAAMREVRIALLEADVALPVAKTFIDMVKQQAIGQEIIKSVSPAQMVIKIVNDQLEQILSSENQEINLNVEPPAVILMAGLQGSGKTTSTGKLAHYLQQKRNKRVMLASLDVYRPAAQKQLEVLAGQVKAESLPIIDGQKPLDITTRALKEAKLSGMDALILDTAGRLQIDNNLMEELQKIQDKAKPVETFLVADALTGQDAVNIAKSFKEKVELSGIILTRVDGDGRGGAALSMKEVTGCPIKFIGVGEKISEFEEFKPERIAGRILGMGDVVSLVEKAAASVDEEEAKRMEKKLSKGRFDLYDLAKQLKMMKKMGGMGSIMGMLPGMGKIKKQMEEADIDEKIFDHMQAIIYSMTKGERKFPKVINASRKKRIAKGAGVEVQDVNRLLKQFFQMQKVMKKLGKMDKKSLMRGGLGGIMPRRF